MNRKTDFFKANRNCRIGINDAKTPLQIKLRKDELESRNVENEQGLPHNEQNNTPNNLDTNNGGESNPESRNYGREQSQREERSRYVGSGQVYEYGWHGRGRRGSYGSYGRWNWNRRGIYQNNWTQPGTTRRDMPPMFRNNRPNMIQNGAKNRMSGGNY